MSGGTSGQRIYDVVVVGAGAAGVGVGVALRHAGVKNFVILDRLMVGASFALWPAQTRLITPSFPTNAIGMLDLNAVALGTSPGFIAGVEHPTGEEYAVHLNAVAQHYGPDKSTGTLRLRRVCIDNLRLDVRSQPAEPVAMPRRRTLGLAAAAAALQGRHPPSATPTWDGAFVTAYSDEGVELCGGTSDFLDRCIELTSYAPPVN